METIDSFSITTHYSLLKMEEPDNNEMEREIVKVCLVSRNQILSG